MKEILDLSKKTAQPAFTIQILNQWKVLVCTKMSERMKSWKLDYVLVQISSAQRFQVELTGILYSIGVHAGIRFY